MIFSVVDNFAWILNMCASGYLWLRNISLSVSKKQEGHAGAVVKYHPLVSRGPGFETVSLHCTVQG